MEIYGDKVYLTKITTDDLDFICKLECDRNLWYFEEDEDKDEQSVREQYLEKINETDNPENYDFIIRLVGDDKQTPIGLAQAWSYVDYRQSWEIGYAILPEYSGQGCGKEAVKLLLKFVFEQLKAHKVVGMCNSKNERSAALMERIGMRREGVFKEELLWNDTWTDQYFYSILEKEFFESSKL
jgi:[ribosomal protein S5]-alanine N-acetyltransferase